MWTGATEALKDGMTNVAFLRTNIEIIDRFFAPGEVSAVSYTHLQFGHQFTYSKTGCCHSGGALNGKFYYLVYTMILLGAKVIIGYGLHSLIQPHHNHEAQENNLVYNTKCANSQIDIIFFQTFVN